MRGEEFGQPSGDRIFCSENTARSRKIPLLEGDF